jgi:hypothetical protein
MVTFSRIAAMSCVVLSFCCCQNSSADVITILNPSFEDPILNDGEFVVGWNDWVLSGASPGGTWNINNSSTFWNTPAPDGNQIGYLAGTDASGSPADALQNLGVNLSSNADYVLSVDVGHPIGFGSTLGTEFTIELLAGGNVLSSFTGTGQEGSFQNFQLLFNSTGSAFVGQELAIRLASSRDQSAFDALSLSFTAVPEPSVFSLLALGTVVAAARRRARK